MSNYKIRVNSKSESREVQGLFFELDYNWFKKGYMEVKTPETIMSFENGALSTGIRGSINHKEITLPQLRDLVVLKRNDVGDANYKTNYGTQCYITGEDVYAFQDNKWFLSAMQHKDILDMIKPIEKPMKEYLRKNNDGEYILEVTDEREAQEPHAKHWIEVPKGCDYLISVLGVNSFIDSDMFAKFKTKNVLWSRKPMKEYLNKETYAYVKTHDLVSKDSNWIEIPEGAESFNYFGNEGNVFFLKNNSEITLYSNETEDWAWQDWGDIDFDGVVCLWSRHTHPEELPFIDDECYTNKSDGVFSLPKSEPCDISNWVEIREEGSLNDQYAEIEKVRQSHRTASEIADSALKHIRERAETYDQPTGERSAAKTAKAFNAITGKDITESEVWLLLQLLKDVRQWSREDYHQDSAEDCIAYAALKAESLEGGE